MYGELLHRAADDIAAGGVVRQVLAGHERDPGPSALALRLAGSVHRLVLHGRAPELAAFYPSVGGVWRLDGGWDAFADVLRSQGDAVRGELDRPPQTNEVGRAAALMGGLHVLGETYRHPVRLFEIGASGGLNLLVERYCYLDDAGRTAGDPTSPVVLRDAWRGRTLPAWPDLDVVTREGSDVLPVDVATEEGRLTLRSYVWPDQGERLDRLSAAFEVAGRHPLAVRKESADRFVERIEPLSGTTTVLWHSVMWQYVPGEQQRAIEAALERLGASATEQAPFAHLALEPVRRTPDASHEFLVVLQLWPTGQRRILGSAAPHGVPTTWE